MFADRAAKVLRSFWQSLPPSIVNAQFATHRFFLAAISRRYRGKRHRAVKVNHKQAISSGSITRLIGRLVRERYPSKKSCPITLEQFGILASLIMHRYNFDHYYSSLPEFWRSRFGRSRVFFCSLGGANRNLIYSRSHPASVPKGAIA